MNEEFPFSAKKLHWLNEYKELETTPLGVLPLTETEPLSLSETPYFSHNEGDNYPREEHYNKSIIESCFEIPVKFEPSDNISEILSGACRACKSNGPGSGWSRSALNPWRCKRCKGKGYRG